MDLFLAPRAGIWCRSVAGWDAFRAAIAADTEPPQRLPEPFPELLPARESRRAPLHVRLALEAGLQACRGNGVDPAQVMTVFASAMGDAQITEYMCRTLAGPEPALSPTRFHNSVHNAASGYWSIGTGNRHPGTSVAAQQFTFPIAVLEAAALATAERHHVLLIVHDVAAPAPLDAVCANRQPFAAGIILDTTPAASDWLPVRIERRSPGPADSALGMPWLSALAAENYSAGGLPLLLAMAGTGAWPVILPAGTAACLVVSRRD
jgi:hypothetical protein